MQEPALAVTPASRARERYFSATCSARLCRSLLAPVMSPRARPIGKPPPTSIFGTHNADRQMRLELRRKIERISERRFRRRMFFADKSRQHALDGQMFFSSQSGPS